MDKRILKGLPAFLFSFHIVLFFGLMNKVKEDALLLKQKLQLAGYSL